MDIRKASTIAAALVALLGCGETRTECPPSAPVAVSTAGSVETETPLPSPARETTTEGTSPPLVIEVGHEQIVVGHPLIDLRRGEVDPAHRQGGNSCGIAPLFGPLDEAREAGTRYVEVRVTPDASRYALGLVACTVAQRGFERLAIVHVGRADDE